MSHKYFLRMENSKTLDVEITVDSELGIGDLISVTGGLSPGEIIVSDKITEGDSEVLIIEYVKRKKLF